MEKELDDDPALPPPPGKSNLIVCLLLVLTTLVLYNPVNRHPFVNYDDDRYVTENPHVRQGLTSATIAWALTSTEQANWHPVTWMSHALDVSLFRMNPAGHHLTSVALHILNALLLYLLLAQATGRMWPSLFVALLFALHPIQVESVAWIAERKNVLCTLFLLLAFWAYGRYAQRPSVSRYIAVAAAFALGLMSKPMVITLPFVLLLIDYWPLGRIAGWTQPSAAFPVQQFPARRLVFEKIPLLAMSVAGALITMSTQQAGGAVRSTEQFSFGVRVANAVYAYAMYLWKTVCPLKLAPLYPHPGASLGAGTVALSAIVLVAITALAFRFRERRYLLAGWLFFLGTLVPVIGLVQVGDQAMADRYAYIPLIGIFVMISFAAADLVEVGTGRQAENRRSTLRYGVIACGAVVLVLLGVTTRTQIGYWQTNVGLWSHALAVTEKNFVAEDNLGGALILEGKTAEAHPHFVRASEINPRDPMSQSNLGVWLFEQGQFDAAIQHYKRTIELTSDRGLVSNAYAGMGSAYRMLGDRLGAREAYEQSLRTNPNQASAWLGLGILAEGDGRLDEAVRDLSRAAELQPHPQTFVRLGDVLGRDGRRSEARDAYQQALKLDPEFQSAKEALAHLSP